ncbi:MAG: hypothetical protein VB082_10445 [Christensenella sp.]|nr:hypothetical protein [Christensenella sp.]
MKKIICIGLAAAMALSLMGCSEAASGQAPASAMPTETAETVKEEPVAKNSEAEGEPVKEETVYVISDASGSPDKIIVSDWLKNAGSSTSLQDYSELSDIENVKGNETFTAEQDGNMTWTPQGTDIYYQGTSNKELPVGIAISYTLDGKETRSEDMEGKSGHVVIQVSYTNRDKQEAEVGGVKKEIYAPYLALSTIALNNDDFKNITVSDGGKVVDDGSRSIVTALTFPGMNENLEITNADQKLPEKVTIEADTNNFSLLTILSVVTNQIFSDMDSDKLGSLDDTKGQLDELLNASRTIEDGAKTLYDGAAQLSDGALTLDHGVSALLTGGNSLVSGSSSLLSGMESISGGAQTLDQKLLELQSGLLTAKTGSQEIAQGTQLVESNIALMTGKIGEAKQGSSDLYDGIEKIAGGAQNLGDGMDNAADTLDKTVAADQKVLAYLKGLAQQDPEDQTLQALIGAQEASIQGQQGVSGSLTSTQGETLRAGVNALTEGAANALSGAGDLKDGMSSLYGLLQQFSGKTTELNNGAQELAGGITEAYGGSAQLEAGAKELYGYCLQAEEGAGQLNSGAQEMNGGIAALKSGSAALVNGTNSLALGSQELSSGIETFNTDGIDKLYDKLVNELLSKTDVLQAMVSLAGQNQTYGGKPAGMPGSVTYIYRTQSIGDETIG